MAKKLNNLSKELKAKHKELDSIKFYTSDSEDEKREKREIQLSICNDILKDYPNDLKTITLKADILWILEYDDECIEFVDESLKKYQNNYRLMSSKAYALLFKNDYNPKNCENALKIVDESFKIIEKNTKKNSKEALEVIKGLMMIKTSSLNRLERYQECIDYCNKMLKIYPHEPILLKNKKTAQESLLKEELN